MTELKNPHLLAHKFAKIDANMATPKHNAGHAPGFLMGALGCDLYKTQNFIPLKHRGSLTASKGILLAQKAV